MNTIDIKLNPGFVTGFSDAEANFYVRISKKESMKVGWTVEPVFSIRLHEKDLGVLNLIQAFFGGIGKVHTHPNIGEARFIVSSILELDAIISHFDEYSLLSKKLSDFILFKQVINLIKNKEHLTLEGISKIANIKASMNTKKEIEDISGNISPVPLPILPTSGIKDPHWIAGFTAGEGCFSVSVIKSKAKLGKTSWIRFILTQHTRDLSLMKSLETYFGCGKINQDSKATYFVVQRLCDLTNIIIPFFDKHPIVGAKVLDYEDLKRVAELMNSKAHLTREGLEQIQQIKSGMNTLRRR